MGEKEASELLVQQKFIRKAGKNGSNKTAFQRNRDSLSQGRKGLPDTFRLASVEKNCSSPSSPVKGETKRRKKNRSDATTDSRTITKRGQRSREDPIVPKGSSGEGGDMFR